MGSQRASWWSITINNPIEEDRDRLRKENLPSFVKAVHSQDEKGEEGTLHIQGAVNTAQVRFSKMKEWLPRAHIEVARDKQALLKYVKKEDTAIPGTQKEVHTEFWTMEKALIEIAWEVLWITPEEMKAQGDFWYGVCQILQSKPNLVSLLTNPQMERAWNKTRSVWMRKAREIGKEKSNEIVYNGVESGISCASAQGGRNDDDDACSTS